MTLCSVVLWFRDMVKAAILEFRLDSAMGAECVDVLVSFVLMKSGSL